MAKDHLPSILRNILEAGRRGNELSDVVVPWPSQEDNVLSQVSDTQGYQNMAHNTQPQ